MNNDYMELKGSDYERLYARYLEDPGRLLRESGVELTKDTRLLDLCSGSGSVVRAAMELGISPKNIVAVERSGAMTEDWKDAITEFGGTVLHESVSGLPLHWTLQNRKDALDFPGFDIITCRQAVNYWWGLPSVTRVCSWLAPGGVFVFNTFNTPPDDRPQTKQYIHQGAQFAEIAFLDGSLVRHVQAREGMPMHLTQFWWIDPDHFEADLRVAKDRGDIVMFSRRRDGTTDTYVCYAPRKETP